MKRWLIWIGVVLLLVLVIVGIKGYGTYKLIQGFKNAPVPKQTVSTIKADFQDWQPDLSAIGSIRAVRGADLSAEVAGIVDVVRFESGEDVKSGQLLLRLRDADDQAHLNSLKASADVAETTYKRDQAQLEAQAISQALLETDSANLKSAKAQVAQQQALLDKKIVRAPFAGHLGIRAADIGQYLNPGDKIVTLQMLDPIFVDFSLPQQALAQIKTGQTVSAHSDTYPDASFSGTILAIDPKIDTGTRNVQVRAQLQNPDRKLLPGMFADVSIAIGAAAHYITLPTTAVAYNPYGETVYVVTSAADAAKADEARPGDAKKPANDKPADAKPQPPADPNTLVAKQVFVTVGPKRGDQVAILTGINPGDQVVTSGQLKLRNGALVVINNSVMPSTDPKPKPEEQ